ncbi:GTP pyrophosphokinase [Formivibrio citricus]|uniref:GTP pyrophosphokinase n=1 Tax=Formivibrio citricus TaxID=83765 RepID=A0A1I5BM76_9NEIS|nr:bifunctional (p)ppGpp synthetase/guanosine-3',5'-bis(diphosphate) 3'-pyrophosphohydrolase [Formivibrio citricus]SFN75699.1 GTP pyrophosphokinase [Formivibrio citricus]
MVAVTRPLAQSIAEADNPQHWLKDLSSRYSQQELERISAALHWAQDEYRDKTYEDTGCPLLRHAIASASIVADLRLDADSVIATLLFAMPDIKPDVLATIEQRFGIAVVKLIESIRKIRELVSVLGTPHNHKHPDAAQQIEALRKMILALVEDIRAILIRLAWRTQTMHAVAKAPDDVRRRIAQETRDLYAPLANRLGVWQIKWELEDLTFRYLHPEPYKRIAKLLDERRVDRENFINEVLSTLRRELNAAGVKADLMGRPKHIYSIWKKMQQKKLDFSEVYDVRAVRILVDDLKDCYTALGIVHHLWQPIPGEFDDYISHPKGNFYRSLHTAVIGPEDKAVEVQIRTFEMHEHAEYGVAAHWRYKEGGQGDSKYEEKIAWLRQLLDWREDMAQGGNLADAFKSELFDDTIYLLTPAGRVVALPKGSTPVDFAYHVHTDLGHRCRGAKVNGQIVPLYTALENGQRVEILAAKEGGPSLDWLHQGYVKSHRAEQKIRHWIRQQNQDIAIEAGRTLFEREASRAGVTHHSKLEAIAARLERKSIEDVYLALGHGEISLRELAATLTSVMEPPAPPMPINPDDLIRAARADQQGKGVLIEGVDQLMTLLAKCCKPVPPDPVIGFVTKGRGISIHRTDCPTLKRLAAASPERLIRADWGKPQAGQVFAVEILVEAHDRHSLLRDLSEVLAREKINVTAVNTLSKDNRAQMRFTIEIRDTDQLQRIFVRLSEVVGVIHVYRV